MSIDLKPCPFCGKPHEARVVAASEVWDEPSNGPFPNDESYSVMCDASTENGERGCGSASGYFISERQAIAAWNRRSDASLADAQAEIARLRGALEKAIAEMEDDLVYIEAGEPGTCDRSHIDAALAVLNK